jgi:hypothetical protein
VGWIRADGVVHAGEVVDDGRSATQLPNRQQELDLKPIIDAYSVVVAADASTFHASFAAFGGNGGLNVFVNPPVAGTGQVYMTVVPLLIST